MESMQTDQSQENLIGLLADTLAGENATATFACGGTIASKFVPEGQETADAPAQPILFYEDKEGQAHKITFPASAEDMAKLSADCEAATFGVGGEDKLDTEYRSAWKLDNTKFATSFHPFDSDIMEVVKQLLFSSAIHIDPFQPIIVAELYKLNIYKGPHDKFKPHVDTPRAQNQFGSLVVCLPSAHTGGELAVRHDQREVKFDWSKDSKSIQWAAFYSDCEHEVLPVTSGYRVTLTYNLYYNKKGCQIPAISNWGSSSLPLYEVFSEALQSENFMPHGGVLGVYCHHNYAHASNYPYARLPAMMKGADAALLAVCKAFNLKTQARPVYSTKNHAYDDTAPREQSHDPVTLFGVKPESDKHLSDKNDDWIGTSFLLVKADDNLGDYEEDFLERLRWCNWVQDFKGIHWVNEPQFHEGNRAFITYGNEASIDMLYSAAAILILVPKWYQKRGIEPYVASA